ncbi:nuclear transport factor 2 family protein [Leptospira biflexa]|uniref:nuclear transport factor 2 family protein n=1 Tax=Leptospira biflexa TaxID=172 RepID=UPI001083BB69|nr:nuclear transport factor 2 family protein [Leptospira biflexa]TGM37423.1 nuclear transport factor 2 family protein [Leptospira biflexa]TGM40760.1 nuclear transport factor 2 family protein [Leptospira biflexa]TGM46961.1 nuclear transport factor 2 family protein [Leptospira biflexa]TGM50573.1 nuclear transport factor 2 family protein [Leptospira biflexa]
MEISIQTQEIESLEKQLIEAIKKSDISFLESVMHEDLRFIAPNGLIVTKEMDLDSHKNKTMLVESIVSKLEEIQIINDTAIVLIVYDTKGTMLGNPIEGRFRYMRVWKQFSIGYQIIAGSCIKIES